MATQGTRTPNLPLKTVADEFLCNTNSGSGMETVRVSAEAVRAQIAIGSGVAFATWAALNATTGTAAGQRAEVHGDAGTHTDPVVGGTKANSGVYGWSTSPAGWRWLSSVDFTDQAGSADPLMDGTASAGVSTNYSREDHVHPTDTSRAPLASPAFTGFPTTTAPLITDDSNKIPNTNWVWAVMDTRLSVAAPLMNGAASAGTATDWSREDHVHPTDTSRAPLASPAFTGFPTTTAPLITDDSNKIPNTNWVWAVMDTRLSVAAPLMNGAASAGTATDWSREDHVHPTDTSRAPLASPAFTGNPTAPTPAGGDNDTSIATTAFVQGELADYALLNSPALTGNPTAPTPASGDNDTSIATTAFVTAADTPIIRGEVNNRFRPGDAPFLFSATKAGRAENLTPLSPSNVVVNADGASYRVTAAATVVSREAIWVPPGRTWRCRTNYRRATNPSDPINDAVRTSVVWLDKDYAFLSTQVIVTDAACTTANGRRSQSFDLPSPPANGVFARLMVETFGGDGVTDIELLAFLDITDAPVVQRLYQGLWDADANSPALASGVGTQGHYYIVKTAGTTLIDGVSSWAVGDWIIFNGSAWEKLLNADGDTLVTIASTDGITTSQSGNDFSIGLNMTAAMDQWLDTLPTDPAPLGAGEWWNNGGIPTRTV